MGDVLSRRFIAGSCLARHFNAGYIAIPPQLGVLTPEIRGDAARGFADGSGEAGERLSCLPTVQESLERRSPVCPRPRRTRRGTLLFADSPGESGEALSCLPTAQENAESGSPVYFLPRNFFLYKEMPTFVPRIKRRVFSLFKSNKKIVERW